MKSPSALACLVASVVAVAIGCGSASSGGLSAIGDPPGAGGGDDGAGTSVGGTSASGGHKTTAGAGGQSAGLAFGGFNAAGGSTGGAVAGIGGSGGAPFGHGPIGMGGGGTGGNGGSSGGAAGSSGTGGSGPSGGSSATGLGTVCSGLDAGGVYAIGALVPGDATSHAVAPFTMPTSFCTGFPAVVVAATLVPTSGTVAYLAGGAATQGFHAVADPLVWDGAEWQMPANPSANDTPIDVSMCAPSPGAANALFAYPDSGALVYGCNGSPPRYFDSAGQQVLSNDAALLALGHDGLRLVGAATLIGPVPAILDAQDMELPLTGTQFETSAVRDARAAPSGFFLAVDNSAGGVTLIAMDADGTAMQLGDFPPVPAGVTVLGTQSLDAAGALFALVTESDQTAAVMKRTANAASAELVLEDKKLPAFDAKNMAKPGFAMRAGGASLLFR